MDLLKKEEFAIAKTFLPLLNTAHFSQVFGGKSGDSMPIDEQGLIRSFESICFAGTKFKIIARDDHIVQVTTSEYPYQGLFFTDERLLEKANVPILEREKKLPSSQDILETFSSLIGIRYFWGGNCLKVPEMLSLYPPKQPLSHSTLSNWTLEGFDCSGLIYYASQGTTPRNTSSWISFGKGIPIEGKSLKEIFSILQPLDAILWKGHIIFVLDPFHTIESRSGRGVVITKIEERFLEILKNGFTPKNSWQEQENPFVIRRWHPDFLI